LADRADGAVGRGDARGDLIGAGHRRRLQCGPGFVSLFDATI
jgi:hypothetical protein